MDKLRTKRLAAAVGVPTPEFVVLRTRSGPRGGARAPRLPMIVKPASQGSSVGMTRVEKAEELPAAWRAATQHEPVAFAEPWITGAEYTVAILQGAALPSIRIETPRAFYDYEAKYLRDDTRQDLSLGPVRRGRAAAGAAFAAPPSMPAGPRAGAAWIS